MSSSGILKSTGIPVISGRGLQAGDQLIPKSMIGIMLVHAICKKDKWLDPAAGYVDIAVWGR
jgi:hypothetical protein